MGKYSWRWEVEFIDDANAVARQSGYGTRQSDAKEKAFETVARAIEKHPGLTAKITLRSRLASRWLYEQLPGETAPRFVGHPKHELS